MWSAYIIQREFKHDDHGHCTEASMIHKYVLTCSLINWTLQITRATRSLYNTKGKHYDRSKHVAAVPIFT